MDTSHTVTLYAVVISLIALALASVAIWSRRELRMRLVAVVLAMAMAPTAWYVFSQLPGKPDDMSAEQFRESYRCSTVLHAEIKDKVGILMLVKREDVRTPEYLFVQWNMLLAKSLQKGLRDAKRGGKGWIIYAASSCGEEGEDGDGKKRKKGKKKGSPGAPPGTEGQEQDGPDGFNFYPDPVPPNPEKNYGPLFEGPVTLPERS
jgi:hypothetical protein